MNEAEDNRTLQELAIEAESIQDAVNICGLAQAFAKSMKRLLRILGSTEMTNQHPITKAWVSKFDSLAGGMTDIEWQTLQLLTL